MSRTPKPLEDHWKNHSETIASALHTEGQPKLKFMGAEISRPLKPTEKPLKTITLVLHGPT